MSNNGVASVTTGAANGIDITTADTTTETPEDTVFHVEENLSFSSFDFSSVNKIIVEESFSGPTTKTLTDSKSINDIIDFVRNIGGVNPHSSKGYSGNLYRLEMYRGETLILRINFMGLLGSSGNYLISSGIYEIKDGHTYSCVYTMSGVDGDDVSKLLGEIIK